MFICRPETGASEARTPVEDLTMFEDQQAMLNDLLGKTMLPLKGEIFFLLAPKRWARNNHFPGGKKELCSYTRSSRKGWLEKIRVFFSTPLHLFFWKL